MYVIIGEFNFYETHEDWIVGVSEQRDVVDNRFAKLLEAAKQAAEFIDAGEPEKIETLFNDLDPRAQNFVADVEHLSWAIVETKVIS